MTNLSTAKANKSPGPLLPYPGATLDAGRAQKPALPELPYKPYSETPLPEPPYKPYSETLLPEPPYKPYSEIDLPKPPYEPYKGM